MEDDERDTIIPIRDLSAMVDNTKPTGFETLAECIAAVKAEIAARRRQVSESPMPTLRGETPPRLHLFGTK